MTQFCYLECRNITFGTIKKIQLVNLCKYSESTLVVNEMKDRLLYGGIESDQCLQTENLVGWSNKEDATT